MKKLLLVSSSPTFLERNLNLLKRTDLPVLIASNGKEALAHARQHAVDLIISEMKLDDMGGDELCSFIFTEHRKDPVSVALVCHDINDELDRARKSGANAWLKRPVQPLQLLETVGRLLDTSLVRHERVALGVRVQSLKDGREFACWSHDVSVSGILLESDEPLATGDRIVCRFLLPGACRIESDGEVVRAVRTLEGGHRYGVRFIDLAPAFGAAIDAYISAEHSNA